MKTRDSPYRAPRWARNAHVQSMLASSPRRVALGARLLANTGAVHAEHLLDAGDGVRLMGIHSHLPEREARGLAILFHGWEGSAESGYMRLTAVHLLQAGFDVFRLNFRDHGPTHHLNEGVFHSCRLDEVLHATCEIARRWPLQPLVAGGFSLGGNFALRIALQAPAAGLPLLRVVAVCPALHPERTTTAMENGFPLYRRYFLRRWTRSLRRKRELFPHAHDYDSRTLKLGLRELTAEFVTREGGWNGVDDYFDGYRISAERLAGMQLPCDILAARDDPVIPFDDFPELQLPDSATLELAQQGGHCGFLLDHRLNGYAERWVVQKLCAEPL